MKYRVGDIIGLVPDAAPAFKHSKIKKGESIDPPYVPSTALRVSGLASAQTSK
jgi:hypothetical protein